MYGINPVSDSLMYWYISAFLSHYVTDKAVNSLLSSEDYTKNAFAIIHVIFPSWIAKNTILFNLQYLKIKKKKDTDRVK